MSTGLHARPAKGLTVAEREALLFVFFLFLTGARNQAESKYMREGGGICFLCKMFGFIFTVLRRCCGNAVLPLSYMQHTKEVSSTLPGVCTYARTVCGVRLLFLDGAWSSWHLQIACLHPFVWAVCSVPFFFLVSERSGRNRPRRGALVHTYL